MELYRGTRHQKIHNRGNPLFMWEEHKVYFTSETLKDTVERCGLDVIDMKTHGKSIELQYVSVVQDQSQTGKYQDLIFRHR